MPIFSPSAQLHIVRLQFPDDPQPPADCPREIRVVLDTFDTPFAIHIIRPYALAFIISRSTHVHLVDIESGTHLAQTLINPDHEVIASAPCLHGLGIMLVHGRTLHTTTVRIQPRMLIARLLEEDTTHVGLLMRIAARNDDAKLFTRHHLEICAKHPEQAREYLTAEWGTAQYVKCSVSSGARHGFGHTRSGSVPAASSSARHRRRLVCPRCRRIHEVSSTAPSLGPGQFSVPAALKMRGMILFLVGALPEAVKYARHGLRLYPKDPLDFGAMLQRVGKVAELVDEELHAELERTGKYAESAKKYTQALEVGIGG